MIRGRSKKASQEVVVWEQSGGLLLLGDDAKVAEVVTQLSALSTSPTRVIKSGANALTLATAAYTLANEHGSYVKLTQRSMELLKQYGHADTGSGSFWGVVRNKKHITQMLDFEKVPLSPTEAASLQTLAVSMALQAAIKDVLDAVERVEGKVDDVLRLIRAERVGDVLGTRRSLASLLARVTRDGKISSTDWTAVASIGPDTARVIQALREYLRGTLTEVDAAWRPGDRVKESTGLLDAKGLLRESLALLVISEYNLAAWHTLRIAHVAANEKEHLEFTVEDAQSALAVENSDDQQLVLVLRGLAERLTTPAELDGLFPWQRGALNEARLDLDALAAWFADQRLLDLEPLGAAPYPTVRESLGHATRTIEELAGRATSAVRRRTKDQQSGVLESAEQRAELEGPEGPA